MSNNNDDDKNGGSEPDSYSSEELRKALESLTEGDDADGCAHLYGHGDPNHKLSMLQTITATCALNYQRLLSDSSSNNNVPSEADLLKEAEQFHKDHGPLLNLQSVIQRQSPRMALAAEFKRASPSKGDIAPHLKAGAQASLYASAGANIISVLTEPRWFKGSLQDMKDARLETTTTTTNKEEVGSGSSASSSSSRPAILRKEFITSRYQIAEAAANGADTVLLIVAVLSYKLLKELIQYCREKVPGGPMEPLVEVHAPEELNVALRAGARVIGVNNRNLHTFQMDLETTERTAKELEKRNLLFRHDKVPKIDNNNNESNLGDDVVVVKKASEYYTLCSLSGMSSCMDVHRYRQAGVGMCLIGESLMRAADPRAAIVSLCLDPKDFEKSQQDGSMSVGSAYTGGTKLVKVCGITNPTDALVACQAGANLIGVIFAAKSKRVVNAEQAAAVVQAVRDFGERKTSTSMLAVDGGNGDDSAPLAALVGKARTLQEASRRPLVVGVFQNQSPEFIREMVSQCGLDLVQLHGKEGMKAANAETCGVPAIRVVDMEIGSSSGNSSSGAASNSEGVAERILAAITNDPVAILLDTSVKGQSGGGTGKTFDWSIVDKVQNLGLPVIIAGGLNTTNVKEAVSTVRPWGVDVSSGVETSPGTKDHDKVTSFVRGAREAAIEASKGF